LRLSLKKQNWCKNS